mgnify:CR=1 FL=1
MAAGIAKKCLIQLSYVIGKAEPLSVFVDTFGTGRIDEEKIVALIRKNFDLTPKGIIEKLALRRPVFRQTAAYGHFGRSKFVWEKTDMAEKLKKQAGV